MRLCWDSEATNLLNCDSIDYTQSPYKLRDSFKVHCAVFIDVDTNIEYTFVQDELKRVKEFVLDSATELIAHNSISYDHPVMKAAYGLDFQIGVFEGEKQDKFYDRLRDSVCGKPITITDTLVMSKTLNPDRQGHSIDYFGKCHGETKIDWRAKAVELGLIKYEAPKGAEFFQYHPEMLVYNRQDVVSGTKTWRMLLREWGDWDWRDAYELEKAVAEIIMRQEHRGFWFDVDKAVEHVKELDTRMEKLKAIVEPLIPAKPLGITAAKEYVPCKNQFKKDGSLSANIIKWVEKHGGGLAQYPGESVWRTNLYGKDYTLPIPQEPIITHMPAKINDTTHIKNWLVGDLDWEPSAYKERDLTVDSKKHKLTTEKYIEACDRYIAQTVGSPFKKDRLEHLEVYSEEYLRRKLYKHDHMKRPMKVYTNPTLTVGMEKEIDPNLLALGEKFSHAKDISDYLTYQHRRNSILGGGVDPDDEEEAEKGWLSVARIEHDHRIPTPADTCGCGTGRMKHRICANVPRVTSPFGGEMRELFGVNVAEGYYQMGYDFASLEAMIESHYCWKYDEEDKAYCKSLTMEKPDDVHTKTAAKISEVLGREFKRTPAKACKYCCAYGGQPKRVAKTIGCSLEDGQLVYDAYWQSAQPLAKLADKIKTYWETTGGKKFILGLDGRKIATRSASALINSLFQSAGVICAKRSMVMHDRALKAEGLAVDFWQDDWKNRQFVQQLIAYHDEAQMEMHKSLIKWKLFTTEEEAKAFKVINPGWSEVGHSDKGYYVGWCKAGELIQGVVKEASKYYKLNVTLAADYVLGRSWKECH